MSPQVAVVVPSRRETSNLEPLLDRLAGALADVDANVPDVENGTAAACEVAGAVAHPPLPVHLLRRQRCADGRSGAVPAVPAAAAAVVLVCDADRRHPPEAKDVRA